MRVVVEGVTVEVPVGATLLDALRDTLPSVRTLGCLGLSRVADRKALAAAIDVVRDKDREDTTRAACRGLLTGTEDVRRYASERWA